MMQPTEIKRSSPAKTAPSPIILLQRVSPPKAIIHIGAGKGHGEMHQWRQWGISHALIIDADADRLGWTTSIIADRPDWHVVSVALAESEGETILAEAIERFRVREARCIHRVGSLAIGDLAVWAGVSADHRDAAFAACRWIIDEVKRRVPIWKNEHYADGESGWLHPDDTPVVAAEHSR